MVDKAEWEQFLQDSEHLADRYESLLGRVKELERDKSILQEKLKTAEKEVQHLRQNLKPLEDRMKIDQENLSKVKGLHSNVARLLRKEEVVVVADEESR